MFHNRPSKVSEQISVTLHYYSVWCWRRWIFRLQNWRRRKSKSFAKPIKWWIWCFSFWERKQEHQWEGKQRGYQHWTIDNSPVHVEEFVKRTGPTSQVPEDGTALDFFLLLWPEDLFEKIVEETNRHAEQCIQTKPDLRWHATACEEMHAFFTLNVLFGIKSLPETRMYWSNDNFIGVLTIQKVMPGNCFEKIRQHLCLNNCFNMLLRDNPAYDKLFKVCPLLDRLANTFRKEYRPSKFVSIDEGMVKYKGRLGFKQYMPMDGGQSEHSLGHCVVCDLVSDLKGKNYHIFCNNFFTSARLVEDLLIYRQILSLWNNTCQ